MDRSIEPADGHVVIAAVDGELTVKRIRRVGERLALAAENRDYAPLELGDETELEVWGVVTTVLHSV